MNTQGVSTGYYYIFYSKQHFTTKLCNFTKFTMLFQGVVIFFPVSNFFKIPSNKRLKVHSANVILELFGIFEIAAILSQCFF